MCGNWSRSELPKLIAGTYVPTSPCTGKFNCIGWAAEDITSWWWPDSMGTGKWPSGVPREVTLNAFIQAFATLGYMLCQDAVLEVGFEKIAFYAIREPDGSFSPTHAAKQLPNGNWSSKLGVYEDIEHFTLDAVDGPAYGTAVYYMKRQR